MGDKHKIMRLKDKVAIVTGGNSGIGAAVAKVFAKEGAKVVVGDVTLGEDTADKIRAAGGEAVFINVDVRHAESVKGMVEKAVSSYGGVDILINNAGVLVAGDVVTMEEKEWDRSIDIKLKGAFLVSKFTIPHMIKRGGGIIINTASAAAISPGKGYSAYGTSNAALVMLTKCMALDFASKKIRVNAVCPGPVETPLSMGSDLDVNEREKKIELYSKHMPVGRMGRPEEIANAMLYLASEEGEFITGTALVIDGGRTLVGIGNNSDSEKAMREGE